MVNERMQQLINAVSNGNKRAFSHLVGVTPTVIENIVGTRKGKPGYELLEKIAFAIENINMDWLLTGRGSMLRTGQDQPIPLEEVKPISPADEAFVYRMYKEEKEENKKLTAKMLKMAEEIGSLKRDLDFLVHQRGVDVPPALDVEDAV